MLMTGQLKCEWVVFLNIITQLVSAEIQSTSLNLEQFLSLFNTLCTKQAKPIRLLGLGISFKERQAISPQLSLF